MTREGSTGGGGERSSGCDGRGGEARTGEHATRAFDGAGSGERACGRRVGAAPTRLLRCRGKATLLKPVGPSAARHSATGGGVNCRKTHAGRSPRPHGSSGSPGPRARRIAGTPRHRKPSTSAPRCHKQDLGHIGMRSPANAGQWKATAPRAWAGAMLRGLRKPRCMCMPLYFGHGCFLGEEAGVPEAPRNIAAKLGTSGSQVAEASVSASQAAKVAAWSSQAD